LCIVFSFSVKTGFLILNANVISKAPVGQNIGNKQQNDPLFSPRGAQFCNFAQFTKLLRPSGAKNTEGVIVLPIFCPSGAFEPIIRILSKILILC
jgi:hypothetical protein